MQARQGDLIVINCKSDGEQGQYFSTFETFNHVMGDSRKYP